MDYYALDFETANERPDSACALGIVGVENDIIRTEEELLINPEEPFSPWTIAIHGITPDRVASAPTFRDLYPHLKPLLEGQVLVAHNAAFDLSVFHACCVRYGLAPFMSPVCCTVRIARALWPELPDHKLRTLSHYLEADHRPHEALSDARVCTAIIARGDAMTDSTGVLELMARLGLVPGYIAPDGYHEGKRIGKGRKPC